MNSTVFNILSHVESNGLKSCQSINKYATVKEYHNSTLHYLARVKCERGLGVVLKPGLNSNPGNPGFRPFLKNPNPGYFGPSFSSFSGLKTFQNSRYLR